MSKQRIKNGNYLTKYFTQFPNIIDDSGLDVYEFRALLHYYRVGECWEGVRTTADKCKMSTGKVAQVRLSLEQKGFIKILPDGDGVTIEIIDKTKENLDKYRPCGEPGVQAVNTSVHVVNGRCSSDEHKNNPIKNNHEESTEAIASTELFLLAGKENKKGKPADPAYKLCVDVWLKQIHPGWHFGGQHGKAIKSIIGKIRKVLAEGNNIKPTEVMVIPTVAFFRVMCEKLPEWFKTKDLSVIDQKFNEIITQIQNGESGQQKATGSDWINDLYARHGKG